MQAVFQGRVNESKSVAEQCQSWSRVETFLISMVVVRKIVHQRGRQLRLQKRLDGNGVVEFLQDPLSKLFH